MEQAKTLILLHTAVLTAVPFAVLGTALGAVLVQHNTYRGSHGVLPLNWNSTLASSAQAWADSCTRQYSDYRQGRVGENIASGYLDFSAVLQAWHDEGLNYNYTADSYNTATRDFTQLVGPDPSWLHFAAAALSALAGRPIGGPGQSLTCALRSVMLWVAGHAAIVGSPEVLPSRFQRCTIAFNAVLAGNHGSRLWSPQ